MKNNVGRRRIRVLPYVLVLLAGVLVGLWHFPVLKEHMHEKMQDMYRPTYARVALNQNGVIE